MEQISITDARAMAQEVASHYPSPLFYEECEAGTKLSESIYNSDGIVLMFRKYLEGLGDDFGHGLLHSGLVAVDAGAIVAMELDNTVLGKNRLIVIAQIAGLLHDIKRKERDHAIKGAEEAKRLLRDTAFTDEESSFIVVAIANHEAFQEEQKITNKNGRLVSDALYDADKFRWGPDNFTTTLWDMLNFGNIDIKLLLNGYQNGMEGIKRIKDTFRTVTGKKYGPEFIEIGLEMGEEIYENLIKLVKMGGDST
jgi:hypothetical protein